MVLLTDQTAQLGFEFLGVHQIGDTDAASGRLVHISRADALAGGADFAVALAVLFQTVQE
ncbi:hypothetical protein D3C76_1371870 [compost metagenome]